MELSETTTALTEIKNSDDDVYKILGQLMVKTKKDSVVKELSDKEKIIELRLKNLEKQESSLNNQLEKLREEILGN